jgi:hypothetical protein
MKSFAYFLRALLTFYFPAWLNPKPKDGGEVVNPKTKEHDP